jgi:hypothetical protein
MIRYRERYTWGWGARLKLSLVQIPYPFCLISQFRGFTGAQARRIGWSISMPFSERNNVNKASAYEQVLTKLENRIANITILIYRHHEAGTAAESISRLVSTSQLVATGTVAYFLELCQTRIKSGDFFYSYSDHVLDKARLIHSLTNPKENPPLVGRHSP